MEKLFDKYKRNLHIHDIYKLYAFVIHHKETRPADLKYIEKKHVTLSKKGQKSDLGENLCHTFERAKNENWPDVVAYLKEKYPKVTNLLKERATQGAEESKSR